MSIRNALICFGIASGILLGQSIAAAAQTFPTRPITIFVPFSAGGGVDVSTRRYADVVSRSIGQRVIVESKPGGGGVVAAMATLQAKPDGHTLYLAQQGTHGAIQWMQTLPFDPQKDFKPITRLFFFPNVLTIPAALPPTNMKELAAFAKAAAKPLTYGSQAVGSPGHMLGAMLEAQIKAPLTHVPYQGGVGMNLDLVAGRLDMAFTTYNAMNQYQSDGKVKFLATASAARPPFIPNVPTLTELGFDGIEVDSWFGLAAARGTPDTVIRRLHDEFAKASENPELIALLGKQGIAAKTNTPAEFEALIADTIEQFGRIIKATGATMK